MTEGVPVTMPNHPSHDALWLRSPRGPLEVGPAPRQLPGAGEVVVQVRAVAVNPVDTLTGQVRRLVAPWTRYPTVIGSDVAGTVVEVGDGVVGLAPGDRVVAFAAGGERSRNRASEGAFQEYVTVLGRVCAPLPDAVPLEQAAVLPLGLATAAAGLYEPDQLALPLPSADRASQEDHTREAVLVWGASTSVGCNAVQLARASGYTVVATAGAHNHDFVRSLGAETVVDHRDRDVDRRVVAALRGHRLVGSIAIGRGSLGHVLRIAREVPGTRRVASVYPDPLTRARAVLARLRGVRLTSIWGGTPVDSAVGPAVFRDFLPPALAAGTFRPAPGATVIGHGLVVVPDALERLRTGVSASKLVVTIGEDRPLAGRDPETNGT